MLEKEIIKLPTVLSPKATAVVVGINDGKSVLIPLSAIIGGTYVPFSGATNTLNLNNQELLNVNKIGIGTATPAYDFEMSKSINGALLLNVVNTNANGYSYLNTFSNDGNTFVGIRVYNTTSAIGDMYNANTAWLSFGSTTACGIVNEKVGPVIFATNTYAAQGEGMRLGANKNVSISGASTTKVTTPLALLHISTGTINFPQIFLPTSIAPSGAYADGQIWREANTLDGLKIRVNGNTEFLKTNKKRIVSLTTTATPVVNTNNTDYVILTLSENVTSFTTGLSGTPFDTQQLIYRIIPDATPRTLAWGAEFVNSGLVSLPTVTVANTIITVYLERQAGSINKWVCMGKA